MLDEGDVLDTCLRWSMHLFLPFIKIFFGIQILKKFEISCASIQVTGREYMRLFDEIYCHQNVLFDYKIINVTGKCDGSIIPLGF